MNLLLVGSLILGGGSAVAMQNENVAEFASNTVNQAKVMFQQKSRGASIDALKETGFPYPNEEFLSTLTDEQAFQIVSAIDVINATYDFSTMTDEEITDALHEIRLELHDLYVELGIEGPMVQTRARTHTRSGHGQHGNRSNYYGTQDGTCLTEDDAPDEVESNDDSA